eukprot:c48608_g1_i1 orf=316-561(+)
MIGTWLLIRPAILSMVSFPNASFLHVNLWVLASCGCNWPVIPQTCALYFCSSWAWLLGPTSKPFVDSRSIWPPRSPNSPNG